MGDGDLVALLSHDVNSTFTAVWKLLQEFYSWVSAFENRTF